MAAAIDGQAMAEQAALIARVGRGDQAAFRELVDLYARAMHRLAWFLLLDGAEAEDVAQDVFTRLWTEAPHWPTGDGRVGGWLYRICTNVCLARLHRRRDRVGGNLKSVQGDRVLTCLAALPDRQRTAIVLTHYETLPDRSAAEMLGMEVKAFESLLFRARSALREALEARRLGVAEAGSAAGNRA